MRFTQTWLRGKGEPSQVGVVELFFDLVFVFAVTQLSHVLLADLTPMGVLRTALLFVGVWWLWINTTWVANWLDADRTPVRLLLFGLMTAGLVVSMALPEAFDGRGLIFACAYVAMQLGRSLFMVLALHGHSPANHRNFLRITIWLSASGLFWITGGLVDGPARLAAWAAATAIEFTGPAAYFRVPGLGRSTIEDWDVDGAHVAERSGLFIIIALGESILITGATVAEMEWTAPVLGAFAAALVGSIAMWWIYFNVGAKRAEQVIAHASVPGALARSAYTYLHIPIVGGLITSAAADEMVIAHPSGHVAAGMAGLLLGGPALYLTGVCAFKWITAGWPPLSHLLGLGALAAATPLVMILTPLQLAVLVAAILVGVAVWETVSLRLSANQGAASAG